VSLHRLTEITLRLPNVKETVDYYNDFGLIPLESTSASEHLFGTVDGGQQLRIVKTRIVDCYRLGLALTTLTI
jgi:hypothetical protein